MIHVRGDNNLVTGNLIAWQVDPAKITPSGQTPTMLLVASGADNVIATNHVVTNVAAKHVVLDAATTGTRVLDSGTDAQFQAYTGNHAFRPTPTP